MIDLTTLTPAHSACPDWLFKLQMVLQGTCLIRAVLLYFRQLTERDLLGRDLSIHKGPSYTQANCYAQKLEQGMLHPARDDTLTAFGTRIFLEGTNFICENVSK